MTIRPGFQVADILRFIVDVGGRLGRTGDRITIEVPDSVSDSDYQQICQTVKNHRSAFLRLLGDDILPIELGGRDGTGNVS